MNAPHADLVSRNSVFAWLALATGLVLLIPLAAMQFTDEVAWNVGDFVAMGALLFGTGVAFVVLARKLPRHRVVLGVALLAALLWLWAELAVGVVTPLGS